MTKYIKIGTVLLCSILLSNGVFSASPAIKNKVYIYNDDGVSPESLEHTLSTFKKIVEPKYSISTLNADAVKEGEWMQDAALFVMPGGADLPYVEKLNGTGNQNIKLYVSSGGSYLGICAGAYYACAYVEFDKGGELEVLGDRELQFFQGKGIGPILAPYNYMDQSGARAAHITLQLDNLKQITSFYNGGGYFENAFSFSNTKVLGCYENSLPAMVHISYKSGNVILSGVHFEYDWSLLDPQDPYLKTIIPQMKASQDAQVTLIKDLLKALNLNID